MAGLRLMSRKTMLIILGFLGGIFGVVNEHFTLGLNTLQIMTTVTAILLWVGFEARLDFKRIFGEIAIQKSKFKDPMFLSAMIGVILEVANESFSLNLPVETIIGFLMLVMSLIFAKKVTETT